MATPEVKEIFERWEIVFVLRLQGGWMRSFSSTSQGMGEESGMCV